MRIIAAHGPAITVRGGACELRDLAVEGTADRDPAVLVRGGRPVLDHCAVSGGRVEIGRGTAELRTCTVEDAEGSGVLVTGTAHAVLEDCVIRSTAGHGPTLSDAARAEVRNTTVERVTGCGIVLTGESQGTFDACTVRHTGDAALLPSACCMVSTSADRMLSMVAKWRAMSSLAVILDAATDNDRVSCTYPGRGVSRDAPYEVRPVTAVWDLRGRPMAAARRPVSGHGKCSALVGAREGRAGGLGCRLKRVRRPGGPGRRRAARVRWSFARCGRW
ncbi:hypothetical protein QFZ22_009683 [Streptomyces canus]|uniref:Right handed beta helix domain-containing protein n=1 Tax=Streptomyces canus TaxID=58343 RepID=A0AAW8FU31_9ACTN|nr:right-handed parallel beta-helix repeat-containing protein [Streptomyces canus]MDQ0913611.1 hypothetical protein [Streptomyces canus]